MPGTQRLRQSAKLKPSLHLAQIKLMTYLFTYLDVTDSVAGFVRNS